MAPSIACLAVDRGLPLCCPNQATRFREFRTPDPPNGLGLFRLDTLGT